MLYYLDTCIWIDYLEERTNTDIFVEIINSNNQILISSILLKELTKHADLEKVTMLFEMLNAYKILVTIDKSFKQDDEALEISNKLRIPKADALHAIIARDNNAELLTRDNHFLLLKDICKIKLL